MVSKSWKNHLKKLLTLAEILSFQKFLFYCPTAQMAEVMVKNMAYRATVYRTGFLTIFPLGKDDTFYRRDSISRDKGLAGADLDCQDISRNV